MAIDTTGLSRFVDECNVPLIRESVFDASQTIDALPNWMTGIKTCAKIGLISVKPKLSDCACGFTPNTDASIGEREICVACIQIMGEICDNDLTEYFTGKWIRRTAGQEDIANELYREYIEDFLANVRLLVENIVWNGDTDSVDTDLNKFDGWLKIIEEDVPAANKFNITSGNPQTAMAILGKRITRNMKARGEVVAFVDPQVQYSLAMSAWAACPCQPGQTYDSYTVLPNGLRIIPAEGLRDTGLVVITPITNFIIGTDFQNDRETFKFWFSDDNQVWRYIIKFYLGVQIAFPNEVIVGTLSDAVLDNVSTGQVDVVITNTADQPITVATNPAGANGGLLTDTTV